ncbi:MAG: bacillithiol biosynthesis deacetylase BshB1 [Bacteroidetes bacterium]|nr:bacillithiol biosynthesis deacetylase BshB1 [Bacteroidota bacterium]
MILDALFFAAHPDDAELSSGGTIAKLTSQGFKVGIIDFTEGELGTRGSTELRYKEAEEASKILKISVRENLKLPDGKLTASEEFVNEAIKRIRLYKPKIVFAPYFNDRHPDHTGAGEIVKKAFFFSGLEKIETELSGKKQAAFRPNKVFYYMQTFEFKPSFVVDITNFFETKMEAVRAYGSQFHNPGSNEPETFISQPAFIRYLESRASYYGFQIRRNYGEPFFCEEEIELDLKQYLEMANNLS